MIFRRHPDRGLAAAAKGMTLIELVAAIVVLGLIVPPVLMFFAETTKHSLQFERQTLAYFLAVEKMEMVMADRHAVDRGYDYLSPANYPSETLSNGFVRTVGFQEVSPGDLSAGQSGSGYLKITVTVTYRNPDGNFNLYSLVCDLS